MKLTGVYEATIGSGTYGPEGFYSGDPDIIKQYVNAKLNIGNGQVHIEVKEPNVTAVTPEMLAELRQANAVLNEARQKALVLMERQS